jgi:hypothetical protein
MEHPDKRCFDGAAIGFFVEDGVRVGLLVA